MNRARSTPVWQSDLVRAAAGEIGFHRAGVASAPNLLALADQLGIRNNRRFDLRTALPGAKSVICVALSYFRGPVTQHSTLDAQHGFIARFARGRDYHEAVTGRLGQLAERLCDAWGDFRYRICVDTGPISDRACAYAAGLGSFGRNTCIIAPEYGSWVVLGELIVDVELAPDSPGELEVCGECRQCVDACPTGALRGDFTMDRARCLSNATQKKTRSAAEVEARLGSRIYGCDTCQEVCPHNLAAKPTDVPEFLADNAAAENPDIELLAAMSGEEFERLFGDTAMRWVGREAMVRNAEGALRRLRRAP